MKVFYLIVCFFLGSSTLSATRVLRIVGWEETIKTLPAIMRCVSSRIYLPMEYERGAFLSKRFMSSGSYQMKIEERVNIDKGLVRRLIDKQFPQWKDLPVRAVAVGGWDNRTFHLGQHMLVRLPSAAEYAMKVEKEQEWLPKLAPYLSLSIPEPLAMGEPDEGYPWHWSVYRWIEGEMAASGYIADQNEFAAKLAHFLRELQSINITDGPLAVSESFAHKEGLVSCDSETRHAISVLKNRVDVNAATKLWEKAIATKWQHSPVWVHGDISAGNLLVKGGRLNGVIDFGGLAIGDPACDLAIAWKFLRGKSREVFRTELSLDEGAWARGRAWALWKALIVAADFVQTNAIEAAHPWRTIEEAIKDFKEN